jgi:hypothetical protein
MSRKLSLVAIETTAETVGEPLQHLEEAHQPAVRGMALDHHQFRPHIKFRAQVVVIEDEPLSAPEDPWQRDEEQEVRRIARLDDVDPSPPGDPPGQRAGPVERHAVLDQVALGAPCLHPGPVPTDVDPVEVLPDSGVLGTTRADHTDVEAGIPQRAGLLPHAAGKGHREVLDEDEHTRALRLSRSHRCGPRCSPSDRRSDQAADALTRSRGALGVAHPGRGDPHASPSSPGVPVGPFRMAVGPPVANGHVCRCRREGARRAARGRNGCDHRAGGASAAPQGGLGRAWEVAWRWRSRLRRRAGPGC